MDFEKEINLLKERNIKVEADKAWETSIFRIVTIAILTYLTVGIVFVLTDVSKPFLSAIIPPIGYILSTQSLPFIKSWWIRKFMKR